MCSRPWPWAVGLVRRSPCLGSTPTLRPHSSHQKQEPLRIGRDGLAWLEREVLMRRRRVFSQRTPWALVIGWGGMGWVWALFVGRESLLPE